MMKKKPLNAFVEVIEVRKKIDCIIKVKYYNGTLSIIVDKEDE